jgi:hypothetical protein
VCDRHRADRTRGHTYCLTGPDLITYTYTYTDIAKELSAALGHEIE